LIHRRLKRVRLLGAFGEEIKHMLAIGLAHAVLTGAQAVGEMFVGARGPFVAEHHGEVAHRARGVGFEQLARGRQREALTLLLLKHSHAGEHTHHAIERGRMRTCLAGDLFNRHGCRVHVVSDAEPRHA